MSKPTMEKPVYTAAEIIEIMKQAKALGYKSITVPGLSAHALDVANGPGDLANEAGRPFNEHADGTRINPSPLGPPDDQPVARQVRYLPPLRQQPRARRSTDERTCRYCHSPMTLGNYGKFYCQPCYIDRKERSRH